MAFKKNPLKLMILGILCVACGSKQKQLDYTQFVDPFIGSGGHGHVFVGANVPFGGIQVGPSNFHKGWDWCSAYHYSDTIVKGFTHLHLSGTGCTDLGEILVMPATGELKINAGSQSYPDSGYASYYHHQTEIVKPGYYSVNLEKYHIQAELTATERTAFHRYTFPKNENSRIIVDLGEGNGDITTDTYFKKIDDTTFGGYRFSKGWAEKEWEFFAIKLSKPVKDLRLFDDQNQMNAPEAKGLKVKAILGFSTVENENVQIKVSISPISIENALENIKQENSNWNFETVCKNATTVWNKELSKIQITSNDTARLRTFYTALYHTMIAPNTYNDVNGDYRGTDKKIYHNPGFKNYTLFSLWDTYRAENPLFTITQPERVSDMVNSMLAIYQQQGELPVWHLRGNETYTMVGYSAVPIIADACLKGFPGIDQELAFKALKGTAMRDREGVSFIKSIGYLPADKVTESVAKALEYSIDDWGIAQLAKKLGKNDDYNYFFGRSQNYKKYFDTKTHFMRGKKNEMEWCTPFDPISSKHRVDAYCEGNAWQYTWLVPQDVEGLISLFGGDKPFLDKLDSLFLMDSKLEEGSSADITGLIGQYAQGNEPGHHIIYMYAYAGEQWKTAAKARYIDNQLYSDKTDGLCGNEDCGQMSAWYIFNALGFYPVNPSNGAYVFGSPLFKKASILLPDSKSFTVEAQNNNDKNIYIQSATLNGEKYVKSYITQKDIMKGGKLTFKMGPIPNKNFGSSMEARPKSIVY